MKLQTIFDRWAKSAKFKYSRKQWLLSKWEVLDGIRWDEPKISLMVENIAQSLQLSKSDCLADLGCGGGWILGRLKKRVSKAYGMDFSLNMLSCAKKHVQKGVLAGGELGKLPFKSETFDSVLSYFVFINMTDSRYVERSLCEIHRVLKKGGRALIGQLPDINGSKHYDAAKKHYLDYCRKNFKLGKSIRSTYQPPINLFDRKKLGRFLKAKNIRYTIRDSFNPFYRPGEPKTINYRFDLILEKF